MHKLIARLAPAVVAVLVTGCATQSEVDQADSEVWPAEPVAVPDGAIYKAGNDVALFENTTARHIGDIVTIRLVEHTDAKKSSSTSTSKVTDVSLNSPFVAGRPVTVNGTPILAGRIDNEAAFDGSGDSKQSNHLKGDITVTVVRRLSNGNLLVRGQKWISINQGKEFVRLEGVVRAIDIEPDNSVPSTKVANAKISYGAKGALADANRPGLLARFFNLPWMPF